MPPLRLYHLSRPKARPNPPVPPDLTLRFVHKPLGPHHPRLPIPRYPSPCPNRSVRPLDPLPRHRGSRPHVQDFYSFSRALSMVLAPLLCQISGGFPASL